MYCFINGRLIPLELLKKLSLFFFIGALDLYH